MLVSRSSAACLSARTVARGRYTVARCMSSAGDRNASAARLAGSVLTRAAIFDDRSGMDQRPHQLVEHIVVAVQMARCRAVSAPDAFPAHDGCTDDWDTLAFQEHPHLVS